MEIKQLLTIDPGNSTGWAYWEKLKEDSLRPTLWGVFKGKDWRVRFKLLVSSLPDLESVWIEDQEMWSSDKSQKAGRSGSLFKLAYRCGWYACQCWQSTGIEPQSIKPSVWKGQLSKPALQSRLTEVVGIEFEDHIADAVGIGMHLIGKL
ncbi:MAG: hypothetical protein ACW99U_19865 [Candidatus Thorarchaeota archaeon]|jgi:hypothetical protein